VFCSLCGADNPNDGNFCVKCGAVLQGQKGMPAPGIHFEGPAQPHAGQAQTSGKAIGSLICGLLFFLVPAAIAAIILGHISLADIRRAGGRLKGHGLAVAGLVLGYGGIAIIPLVLIIAAIAIPNLLRAKMAANEASAVGSLRTINTAAINYSSEYPNGFPPSLAALGGVGRGAAACDHAQLIDSAIESGQRSGYEFAYVPAIDPTGRAPLSPQAAAAGCTLAGAASYEAHADPVNRGTTGQRSFFTDQSGIIRFDQDAPATADSQPLE